MSEETEAAKVLYVETNSISSQETSKATTIPPINSITSQETSKAITIPPTKTQSVVWEHFDKIYNEEGKHIQTKCKYCSQNYSKTSSTSTLKKHWSKYHEKIQPGGIGSLEALFGFSISKPKLRNEDYVNIMEKLIN